MFVHHVASLKTTQQPAGTTNQPKMRTAVDIISSVCRPADTINPGWSRSRPLLNPVIFRLRQIFFTRDLFLRTDSLSAVLSFSLNRPNLEALNRQSSVGSADPRSKGSALRTVSYAHADSFFHFLIRSPPRRCDKMRKMWDRRTFSSIA